MLYNEKNIYFVKRKYLACLELIAISKSLYESARAKNKRWVLYDGAQA